jgi:DNA replication protein DnaC
MGLGRVWVRFGDGPGGWGHCPRQTEECRLGVQIRADRLRSEQAATEIWLRECGVGERYWQASRGRLTEPAEVMAYLDEIGARVEQGRGLVLLGPTGVGKTAALALIAREARGRVTSVCYTTVGRLMPAVLRALRENADKTAPYPASLWGDARLLLLDEFGAAYESDYAMAGFEDFMGWRYDHRLATCVAGNLTPEQIRENPHYARMVDRWRETCVVVAIGGESQRKERMG